MSSSGAGVALCLASLAACLSNDARAENALLDQWSAQASRVVASGPLFADLPRVGGGRRVHRLASALSAVDGAARALLGGVRTGFLRELRAGRHVVAIAELSLVVDRRSDALTEALVQTDSLEAMQRVPPP